MAFDPVWAAQLAKRKLLWSGKKTPATPPAAVAAPSAPVAVAKTHNSWEKVEFAKDESGAQASKFLRLMGMKNATEKGTIVAKKTDAVTDDGNDEDAVAKRAQMFSNMERQFETARKSTHNAKGKGFGTLGPVAQKKYF